MGDITDITAMANGWFLLSKCPSIPGKIPNEWTLLYIYIYIPGWWFGTFFIFHILGRIIPTDFHIFQSSLPSQPKGYKRLMVMMMMTMTMMTMLMMHDAWCMIYQTRPIFSQGDIVYIPSVVGKSHMIVGSRSVMYQLFPGRKFRWVQPLTPPYWSIKCSTPEYCKLAI